MSFKSRVLITAATLTMVGGLTSATALSASAATPECVDEGCISIFSRELGTYAEPNVIEAVLGGVAQVGQPVILSPASSSDPSQDFIPRGGLVSDFYAAGMVSAEVNSHYGNLSAAQIEYSPFGVRSDLCVGLATTAFQNEGLTLQPCTVPATTVWIIDFADYPAGYFTIVNGSTTDFSRPFAMTYPQDQQAADQRLQQITIRRLQFLSSEHTVPDRQLWGALFGVLP
jgi:hypothetical protein